MTTPSAADGARPASGGRAPSPAATTSAGPAAQEPPLLELRDIGKNFGPVRALSDINLDIPVGKVTALVGDNGAGKSTLIKTISGIWQPDHGEILWQGRPVHLHSPKAAADLGIATVYQDLALCDNLDIVQNMFLGREEMKHFQLDEIGMELAAKQTLADLSVVTVRSIRQPVGSLSGGQRQAVAVAKAVMQQAQLVIMDEPTAALGVTQTRVVLELIEQLSSRGIAVLVISHNLNDVMSRSRTGSRFCISAVSPPSRPLGARYRDDRRADDHRPVRPPGRSRGRARPRREPARHSSQLPRRWHARQWDDGVSHRRGTVSTETHQPPVRRARRRGSRRRGADSRSRGNRRLPGRVPTDSGPAHPERRERRPAGHPGPDRHRDLLPGPQLPLPVPGEPGQPADPGLALHHPGHG